MRSVPAGRRNRARGREIPAPALAPKSNDGLRFTMILTRQESRGLILVRRKGGGFSDVARLARQGDLWRVQGTRRLSGKK